MALTMIDVNNDKKSTTVRQATWGSMRFSITAHALMGLTGIDVSESYNDDYNEKGKKIGKERTSFSVNVRYFTPVLDTFRREPATARGMLGEWRKRLGNSAYFYVGGKKFLNSKFKLIGIDANNFILTNKGQTMACDVQLSFIQARTAAQEKAAAKAAKTSETKSSATKTKGQVKVKPASGGTSKIIYKKPTVPTWNGGKMKWPVPGHKGISSNYGWRNCPFHGKEKHSGIDVPAPYGTKVVAAAPGKVVTSSYVKSFGNTIIISHGKKIWTLYAHNSSLVAKKGQSVKAGQVIARVGSTGSSTGNHSHFEVRKNKNAYESDVSPWKYVSK